MKKVALALIMAAGLFPALAAAQAVTGTIFGTVTDTTGAAVPGVTVTLTHTGTGLVRTVVTTSDGEYTAPSLPTGAYTVVAELTGFKTVTVSNVALGVDQRVRVNMPLEVGTMAETVTVIGSHAARADLVLGAGHDGHQRADSKRCRSTAATS